MFRFLSDLNFKLPFLYELSRRNLWILYSIVVPFAFPLFSDENRCRAKINERVGEEKRRLRRIFLSLKSKTFYDIETRKRTEFKGKCNRRDEKWGMIPSRFVLSIATRAKFLRSNLFPPPWSRLLPITMENLLYRSKSRYVFARFLLFEIDIPRELRRVLQL